MADPFPTAKVDGHGTTVPVAKGASGPYEYRVGIRPGEPVVGNLYMAINLTLGKVPVSATKVFVTASFGATGEDPVPALSNVLGPGSYELEIVLDKPGAWTFEIDINGPPGSALIGMVLDVGQGVFVSEPTLEFLPGVTTVAREASQRNDPGVEDLQRILTRQAPAKPTQDPSASSQTTKRDDGRSGEVNKNVWFNWALVGIPMALFGLGLSVWTNNRPQAATPPPGTSQRIQRNRPRRRR